MSEALASGVTDDDGYTTTLFNTGTSTYDNPMAKYVTGQDEPTQIGVRQVQAATGNVTLPKPFELYVKPGAAQTIEEVFTPDCNKVARFRTVARAVPARQLDGHALSRPRGEVGLP